MHRQVGLHSDAGGGFPTSADLGAPQAGACQPACHESIAGLPKPLRSTGWVDHAERSGWAKLTLTARQGDSILTAGDDGPAVARSAVSRAGAGIWFHLVPGAARSTIGRIVAPAADAGRD